MFYCLKLFQKNSEKYEFQLKSPILPRCICNISLSKLESLKYELKRALWGHLNTRMLFAISLIKGL